MALLLIKKMSKFVHFLYVTITLLIVNRFSQLIKLTAISCLSATLTEISLFIYSRMKERRRQRQGNYKIIIHIYMIVILNWVGKFFLTIKLGNARVSRQYYVPTRFYCKIQN